MATLCRVGVVLLSCSAAFACGSDVGTGRGDGEPPAGLLRDAPLFPFSRPTTVAGTSESLEQSYTSLLPADTVASWYRRALDDRGWEILSDSKAPNGMVTILAQKSGGPLWVMIAPTTEGGTVYKVVAAAPDST